MRRRRRVSGAAFLTRRGGEYPGAIRFYILAAFLSLVFLIGGASRGDVQSLIVLRPVAAILLVGGLFYATRQQLRSYAFLFAMAALCVLSVVVQLIPLPFSIWSALPGRELAVRAVTLAGGELPMAPLSLVPAGTWNAFYAMFVPIAVLALATAIPEQRLFRLLMLLLVFGFLSGIIGLLQAVSPSADSLYFYRITNRGAAVGLFANRNHQAALLAMLFPMLAVFASARTGSRIPSEARLLIAIAAGFVTIPLLLVTGSRAGLLLAGIGLVSVPWLYRSNGSLGRFRIFRDSKKIYALLGGGIVIAIAAAMFFSRAVAIQRLFNVTDEADKRGTFWEVTFDQIRRNFPFGSGQGSFPQIYAIQESFGELGPSYANHAHNDWLEVIMVGGAPAALLLVAAVAAVLYAAYKLLFTRYEIDDAMIFGRLGLVIILIFGVASVVDYPLRVPSLVSVFTIAAIWTAIAVADMARTAKGRGAA